MTRQTIFSDDRIYRFTLWREWNNQDDFFAERPKNAIGELNQFVQFIGLNPSTADETQDDPTIRRCIDFAKEWGFGALCMTNLFAFRATDPKIMKAHMTPVGSGNTKWIVDIGKEAALIICAWGNDGLHRQRSADVLAALRSRDCGHKLHCLKINEQTGEPSHLLYLKSGIMPKKLCSK